MTLRRARVILADTEVHITYAAALMGIPESRYAAIPVGTDETVFVPHEHRPAFGPFEVFYYGTMLPLHGISYVIEAAYALRDDADISFRLVGGGQKVQQMIAAASTQGCHISYEKWIPFEELPHAIGQADLCLAGPFGNTIQAQHVVTGKTYQFLASAAPTVVGISKASMDFTDKDDCLLVPQADAAALAAVIRWAHQHKEKLPAIGIAGRKLYEEKYSISALSVLLGKILARLT